MGDITCVVKLVELTSANGWVWVIMGVLLASLLGLTAFCMWCLWVDKREEKKPLCWVRKDADGTIWIQCDKTFKGTVLGVDGKGRVIYEVDDD